MTFSRLRLLVSVVQQIRMPKLQRSLVDVVLCWLWEISTQASGYFATVLNFWDSTDNIAPNLQFTKTESWYHNADNGSRKVPEEFVIHRANHHNLPGATQKRPTRGRNQDITTVLMGSVAGSRAEYELLLLPFGAKRRWKVLLKIAFGSVHFSTSSEMLGVELLFFCCVPWVWARYGESGRPWKLFFSVGRVQICPRLSWWQLIR